MTPEALEKFLAAELPIATALGVRVIQAADGRARLSAMPGPEHVRPGNVATGPALFGLADIAFYVALLSLRPGQRMALTISLTMNFLRAAPLGALFAEASISKLGRRIAFGEMRVLAGDAVVATASGAYALDQAVG